MLTDTELELRKHARSIYQRALDSGRLKPADSCGRCGSSENIHGHHDDYEEPLAILWLCASCHARRHSLLRDKATFDPDWIRHLFIVFHPNAPQSQADEYVARQAARATDALESFFVIEEIIKAVKDA